MTAPHVTISVQDRTVSSPLDDGLLVAQPTDDRLFVFNGSARFMWERLVEGAGESAIPALVAKHYGIDVAQARRDFQRALRRWRAEGLVRPTGLRCRYEIAGLAFDIHYHDADIADVLMPMLTHLSAAPDRAARVQPLLEIDAETRGGKVALRANGVLVLRTANLDELIEKIIFDLFRYVTDKADWQASLHAAAVGTADECVLLPGASGSGKSTLTAALLSIANTRYVTDDLALLAKATLAVIPVPMPLALKSGSWRALDSFLPDLAAKPTYQRFGKNTRYWAPPRERTAPEPLPVRAVIFPLYTQGADTVLTRVSPLDAMSHIAAAPSAIRPPITHAVVDQLAAFARGVPAYALTYGALDEACRAVWDLLRP